MKDWSIEITGDAPTGKNYDENPAEVVRDLAAGLISELKESGLNVSRANFRHGEQTVDLTREQAKA